jgi:ABC-2 type transport system ATP-binding protein
MTLSGDVMIRVSHLTRRYPGCVAVNDVSFDVCRGEIVGFLGPNGAGKTTTMRILSCFLPPTSGSVSIAGLDIMDDSLEVRRRIGYMPENVPLYPEMRVDEYLDFRARLKNVPGRRRKKRVGEVKDLCGLKDVGRRIVGHLSKGFRQRVGLAESLVHDPQLLILDEPTIGLDPNQIRQVRGLIKDLASRHTILLSTHILPEVEMTCQRVLIINQGKIVASDTPANLKGLMRGRSRVTAELLGPREEIAARLRQMSGVLGVVSEPDGEWWRFEIECDKDTDLRTEVFQLAARSGWPLRELRMERKSLEDIFVALTRGEEGEAI